MSQMRLLKITKFKRQWSKNSKIPKRSVEDKKLIERKISEVGGAIKQKLKSPLVPSVGDMVLNQMKENFGKMAKNDQYRILTTMPPECSVEFLKTTFNTTDNQVKQAKAIQAEQGILSTPNPKPGRRLAEESLLKVKQFYTSDDVSKQLW